MTLPSLKILRTARPVNTTGLKPNCLVHLPTKVLKMIFANLDEQWQVCLALSCKKFSVISKGTNNCQGITYSSSAKLHLLWGLEPWMSESRKLCMQCEKYFPISPGMWKDRKDKGRSKTMSKVYGQLYSDFRFVKGKCPECIAEEAWSRVIASHGKLQAALLG